MCVTADHAVPPQAAATGRSQPTMDSSSWSIRVSVPFGKRGSFLGNQVVEASGSDIAAE
jgi:hypothetical protein